MQVFYIEIKDYDNAIEYLDSFESDNAGRLFHYTNNGALPYFFNDEFWLGVF